MDLSQADFAQAEFAGAPAATVRCAGCDTGLTAQYWTAGQMTVCGPCAAAVHAGPPRAGRFGRAFKALLFGCGAGLLGAAGYALIIHFAEMELALVTIAIGWFVGRAVRQGSGGRGGRGYQVLGAVLTYVWCMMAYVPTIVAGATQGEHAVSAIVAIIVAPILALILPFTGEMGVLGTLILAFGVWRGWREPAPMVVAVAGPFELAQEPAPETSPPPAAAPEPAPESEPLANPFPGADPPAAPAT